MSRGDLEDLWVIRNQLRQPYPVRPGRGQIRSHERTSPSCGATRVVQHADDRVPQSHEAHAFMESDVPLHRTRLVDEALGQAYNANLRMTSERERVYLS